MSLRFVVIINSYTFAGITEAHVLDVEELLQVFVRHTIFLAVAVEQSMSCSTATRV